MEPPASSPWRADNLDNHSIKTIPLGTDQLAQQLQQQHHERRDRQPRPVLPPQTFGKRQRVLAATRGVIPRVRWRTQEKGSMLSKDLLSANKVASTGGPRPTPTLRRRVVGLPFTPANNLYTANIHFGDIRDMDSNIKRSPLPPRDINGTGGTRRAKIDKASDIDLNEQAQLRPAESSGNEPHHRADVEELRKSVAAIRGYLELLDQYSLHHFIIYNGRTVNSTPEFESFQRLYGSRWGPIMTTISSLERLLRKHDVPLAVVDGPHLADLAVLEVLQLDELLSCVANLEQIQPFLALRRRSADKRHRRHDRAATTIQAMVRGYLSRKHSSSLLQREHAAVVIQSFFRVVVSMVKARLGVRKKQQDHNARWDKLRDTLTSSWKGIMAGEEHVVVHLPSLSIEEHLRISMRDYVLRQNLQLPRIFDCLATRNATVVYISPRPIPEDILDYNRKLLERFSIHQRRLHILVPENYDRFPPHFSLSTILLYSPRCLNRLRTLVKGKPAYIVPGVPSWPERKLADLLNVPLLSPDPGARQLYAAKSSVKRLFMEANVNVPLGAHDIYDEESLLLSLTKLIAGNLAVDRWLVKLDVDYESLSWAYLDANKLESVAVLRHEKLKLEEMNGSNNEEVWYHQDVQILARTKILQELKCGALARHMAMCSPHMYTTWASFLTYLKRFGAVVEAEPKHSRGYPSVNLFIDPLGKVALRGTYDLVLDLSSYQRLGALHPSTTVPYKALEGACLSISKKLFERGLVGFVALNFVVFQDAGNQQLRMWALDMIPSLSNYACTFTLFDAIRHGNTPLPPSALSRKSIETQTNRAVASQPPAADHYAVLEYVAHPNLSSMSLPAFCKACRLEQVSYNMESRRGVAFLLCDSLASGVLGVLALGHSTHECVSHAVVALSFIRKDLSKTSTRAHQKADDDDNVVQQHFSRTLHVLDTYRARLQGEGALLPFKTALLT